MLNWQFIIDNIPAYSKALLLTLKLAFWGILFSLIIGIVCSILQYYKIKIIKSIINIYIEISRNTPLLIQLYFLYFGITKLGVHFSEETCAIIGLSFLGGSYMAESFRAGLEAVSKTQVESGMAIGLSRFQLARHVIFPQAFSIAIPSVGANIIFLFKETSLVGAIALLDLVSLTKDIIGMDYVTFESLFMLVVSYLIILLPVSVLLTLLERRVRRAEFGS